LIDASQLSGLSQRSGADESIITVTGMLRRWPKGCVTSYRLGELRSNAGSTNTDKEQNDETIAQTVCACAADPN
jgi:hypothetical protein